MLSEVPREFRRHAKHCNSLSRILRDTNCALEYIVNTLQLGRKFAVLIMCFCIIYLVTFTGDLSEDIVNQDIIDKLRAKLTRSPTLLIFGQDCHAKALFVNKLLGQPILPLHSKRWRYVSYFNFLPHTQY